jgi:hypothetical protein
MHERNPITQTEETEANQGSEVRYINKYKHQYLEIFHKTLWSF